MARHTDSTGEEDRELFTAILARLDSLNESKNKGEQLTFTLPQILTSMVFLLTVAGSVLMVWSNIDNRLTTMKVTTDLAIEQLKRDITNMGTTISNNASRMDVLDTAHKSLMDAQSRRLEELDSTVSQLYSNTMRGKPVK